MDIRALRYFVELIFQQSFTRASERLFVAQPDRQQDGAQLEPGWGCPCQHRDGHSFSLTDNGQVLYQRAQTILAEMGLSPPRIAGASRGRAFSLLRSTL